MIDLEKIKEEARYFMEEGGAHEWDHMERVYKMCEHIGKIENADMEILLVSASLHDIGRVEELRSQKKVDHAEIGALMAEEILKNYGLEQDKIDKIKHCILTHRFRNNFKPKTKEAKILFDSDKLDSIGAIGLGRAFNFAGAHGAKVHNSQDVDIEQTEELTREDTAFREFYFKLSKIKDKMYTDEGKKIAKERHNFMVEFFDRLKREINGEI